MNSRAIHALNQSVKSKIRVNHATTTISQMASSPSPIPNPLAPSPFKLRSQPFMTTNRPTTSPSPALSRHLQPLPKQPLLVPPRPTFLNTNIPRHKIIPYAGAISTFATSTKLVFALSPYSFTRRSVFTVNPDESETPEEEMSHIPNTVPFKEDAQPTVVKTDKEWQEQLTSDEYYVLRKAETEARFKGYTDCTDAGVYVCKGCKHPLYDSTHKFDSGCGWPAFDNCYEGAVTTRLDPDGMRIEIICTACHSHLGHVFTGEHGKDSVRHCVNSCCLTLNKKDKE